jgi:polyisoprenyl-phosphate glycosyltransferase
MNQIPSPTPRLSVIIPMFNEEENFLAVYQRLTRVLTEHSIDYELIFVDDASRDSTPNLIRSASAADSHVRLLSFARNFGHQTAVTAGLHFSRGNAVVVMDGDGQDPPELLPQLLEQWQAGYKVVFAQRVRRENESASKKLFAFVYYRLLQKLAEVEIPVDTGDFCLMDRAVVDLLNTMPERNRYIRGLRSWIGFAQTSVSFERPPRLAGEPKYNFGKSLALALDGLFSFSRVPLRLATYLGFITGAAALFMVAVVLYWRLTQSSLNGFAILAAAVFFMGAVQLVTVGILGEYVGRIYEEIKNRPLYVLKEALGFESIARPMNLRR